MTTAPPYHLRTEWQRRSQPVTSSAKPIWGAQAYQVIHWTGHVDSDLNIASGSTFDSRIRSKLVSMQNDYLNNRGYSLGYNWGVACDNVDGWASVWEIRGEAFRSAANGDGPTNVRGHAILLWCSAFQRATPPMIRSVRWLIASRIRVHAPQALRIVGHNDIRPEPTACPSPFIPDVRAGVFQPVTAPPPPPIPNYDPAHHSYSLYPFDRSKPLLELGHGFSPETASEQGVIRYANDVFVWEAGQVPDLNAMNVWTWSSIQACQNVQRLFGLPATGTTDPATWEAIDYLAYGRYHKS